MNALRKAGTRLNEFDTAYAERAARDMGVIEDHPIRHMLGGSPISSISAEGDSMVEKLIAQSMVAGSIGTNLGYRYGLPAAGVTLAGKGLFDLSQGLYNAAANTPVFGSNPADGSQQGQLPLN